MLCQVKQSQALYIMIFHVIESNFAAFFFVYSTVAHAVRIRTGASRQTHLLHSSCLFVSATDVEVKTAAVDAKESRKSKICV